MAESTDRAYRDNPEVAHESSDVSVGGILRFGIVLVIVAAVIHIALYLLLIYYNQREARRLAVPDFVQVKQEPPPEPRLRVAPRSDLVEMRRAEDQILHSYGWVDREKNIARIPIEESMKIIVEKGLPVREQASGKAKTSAGSTEERQADNR